MSAADFTRAGDAGTNAADFAALPPNAAVQAVALRAWRTWICRACGLVYDEAEGDPDSGLAPGTRFEDIPDDWACPLCGVTKADFEPHDPVVPTRRAPAEPVPMANRRGAAGIVIVGAGRAGWQTAQALRERDAAVPITLVTACSGDAYDKPLLSVACARELAPEQWVREGARAMAARLNVRLLASTDVVSIDPAARRLRTTRGSLRYRHLVLAHGATPRRSTVLAPELCWRINDLVAYQRLRAALGTQRRHVVIVGAGLVGSELANDLALEGHGVTLLDVHDRPLAAQLPALASERLLQAWQALPLRFVGGVQVAALERVEGMVCVTTVCGRTFEADQVIAATGLAPAHRLADRASLARDEGGIAVRAADLRTSDPHIHALGDCASVEGRALRYIEPIARQAQAIASAILGDGEVRYVPSVVPLRVKTSAMPFTLHGVPAAGVDWQVDTDASGRLEMTQRVGGEIRARLEATARPQGCREPRLAAA